MKDHQKGIERFSIEEVGEKIAQFRQWSNILSKLRFNYDQVLQKYTIQKHILFIFTSLRSEFPKFTPTDFYSPKHAHQIALVENGKAR